MTDIMEMSKNWTNFKYIEGNSSYPILFKFSVFGKTFFAARDDKGKIWTRKSLLGLSNLVNIKLQKLKSIK